jgi:hypothetical protein
VKARVAAYLRDKIFQRQLSKEELQSQGKKLFENSTTKYNKEGGVTYWREMISTADKKITIQILTVQCKDNATQVCRIYCYMFVLRESGWLGDVDQDVCKELLMPRCQALGTPFLLKDIGTDWQDCGHFRLRKPTAEGGDWHVFAFNDDENRFIDLHGKAQSGDNLVYTLSKNWTACEAMAVCMQTKQEIPLRTKFWEKYGSAVDDFIDLEPKSLEPDGVSLPATLAHRLKKVPEKKVKTELYDFSAIAAAHDESAAPKKKQRKIAEPGEGDGSARSSDGKK